MNEQLWLCLIFYHQYWSLCSISTSLKLENVFIYNSQRKTILFFAKVTWQFCASHWQISSASFFPRWDATACRDEEGEAQCLAWSHSASEGRNHKIQLQNLRKSLSCSRASLTSEVKHTPHFFTKHPRHEALAVLKGGTEVI